MQIRSGMLFVSFVLLGCGGVSDRAIGAAALAPDVVAGEALYLGSCGTCHGAGGAGTSAGPALDHSHGLEETIQTMLDGPDAMPSYEGWADQELVDTAAYTESLAD